MKRAAIKSKPKSVGGRPATYALELPVYDSMENMANSVGIPVTVLKWSKRQGCRFVVHGRCHLGVFLQWWFSRDTQEGEEANEDWAKRDKRATALRKELLLDEDKSRVIDFKLAETFILHLQGDIFFGELERLAAELPASLKGRDENEIKVECDTQVVRVKKNLETKVKIWIEGKGKKQ